MVLEEFHESLFKEREQDEIFKMQDQGIALYILLKNNITNNIDISIINNNSFRLHPIDKVDISHIKDLYNNLKFDLFSKGYKVKIHLEENNDIVIRFQYT